MKLSLAFVLAAGVGLWPQSNQAALQLTARVPMVSVRGRIDHLGVDVKGNRLFVAALGNDTVEVIDVASHKAIRSLRGFSEPQGIRFLPEANKVVVANGGTGTAVFLDATSYAVEKTVSLGSDADNVRDDERARRVWVGYGSGALASLSSEGQVLSTVRLPGHPEAFQLETRGSRIFVNVPSARQVAVVDRAAGSIVASWPLAEARAN
jgi:YVTN family beta-propeller protein